MTLPHKKVDNIRIVDKLSKLIQSTPRKIYGRGKSEIDFSEKVRRKYPATNRSEYDKAVFTYQ